MEAKIPIASAAVCDQETTRDTATIRALLEVELKFFRPIDSNQLVGDNSKEQRLAGCKLLTARSEVARVMTYTELEAFQN